MSDHQVLNVQIAGIVVPDEFQDIIKHRDGLLAQCRIRIRPPHRLAVRLQRHERKATTHCVIKRPRAPIRRIHRPDDINLTRDGELLLGIWQRHRQGVNRIAPLVGLQQRNQLAENPSDIPTVDLVDDQHDGTRLALHLVAILHLDRINERLRILTPIVFLALA